MSLVFSGTAAHAATTLSDVKTLPGPAIASGVVTILIGSGQLSGISSALITMPGSYPALISAPTASPIPGVAIGGSSGTILAGSYLDGEIIGPTLRVLFEKTGGNRAAEFAKYFIMNFVTTDEQNLSQDGQAEVSFQMVNAAIPLPASGLVLISGIGALAALRRRRAGADQPMQG